jgi:hypothetical protein
MPTIYDDSTRRAILDRFAKLSADTTPRWGQMNAPRMMQHVTDGLRMAMGELVIPPKDSPLKFPPLRWLVIHGPFPWPKGAPTAPELLAPPHGDWPQLCASLEAALARVSSPMTAEHPAFGKLSPRDWGVLVWRHFDHHLRQFGV